MNSFKQYQPIYNERNVFFIVKSLYLDFLKKSTSGPNIKCLKPIFWHFVSIALQSCACTNAKIGKLRRNENIKSLKSTLSTSFECFSIIYACHFSPSMLITTPGTWVLFYIIPWYKLTSKIVTFSSVHYMWYKLTQWKVKITNTRR